MQDNKTELAVSNEVLEKMAKLAAEEIDGVAGLCKKTIDIKNKTAFKAVNVQNNNGSVYINMYICVKRDVDVRTVSEAVQQNVKDKIQTMAGTAVTKVNVTVADIDLSEEKQED